MNYLNINITEGRKKRACVHIEGNDAEAYWNGSKVKVVLPPRNARP